MAHARVERVPSECDTALGERLARGLDVLDVQGDLMAMRVVLETHRLGVDEAQCEVAGLELGVVSLRYVNGLPQAQRVAIEVGRSRDVVGRQGKEVNARDELLSGGTWGCHRSGSRVGGLYGLSSHVRIGARSAPGGLARVQDEHRDVARGAPLVVVEAAVLLIDRL